MHRLSFYQEIIISAAIVVLRDSPAVPSIR